MSNNTTEDREIEPLPVHSRLKFGRLLRSIDSHDRRINRSLEKKSAPLKKRESQDKLVAEFVEWSSKLANPFIKLSNGDIVKGIKFEDACFIDNLERYLYTRNIDFIQKIDEKAALFYSAVNVILNKKASEFNAFFEELHNYFKRIGARPDYRKLSSEACQLVHYWSEYIHKFDSDIEACTTDFPGPRLEKLSSVGEKSEEVGVKFAYVECDISDSKPDETVCSTRANSLVFLTAQNTRHISNVSRNAQWKVISNYLGVFQLESPTPQEYNKIIRIEEEKVHPGSCSYRGYLWEYKLFAKSTFSDQFPTDDCLSSSREAFIAKHEAIIVEREKKKLRILKANRAVEKLEKKKFNCAKVNSSISNAAVNRNKKPGQKNKKPGKSVSSPSTAGNKNLGKPQKPAVSGKELSKNKKPNTSEIRSLEKRLKKFIAEAVASEQKTYKSQPKNPNPSKYTKKVIGVETVVDKKSDPSRNEETANPAVTKLVPQVNKKKLRKKRKRPISERISLPESGHEESQELIKN